MLVLSPLFSHLLKSRKSLSLSHVSRNHPPISLLSLFHSLSHPKPSTSSRNCMATMVSQESLEITQESSPRTTSLQFLGLLSVQIEGNSFQTLPPLPIQGCLFRFLTRLDLTIVGLTVNEVPFKFGWKLEMYGSVCVVNHGENRVLELKETVEIVGCGETPVMSEERIGSVKEIREENLEIKGCGDTPIISEEKIESGVEEFRIREIGKSFGFEVDWTQFESTLEENRGIEEKIGEGGTEEKTEEGETEERTGEETGLQDCSLDVFEKVKEAAEASDESSPERTLREEMLRIKRVKTRAGRFTPSQTSNPKRSRTQTPNPQKTKQPKSSDKPSEPPQLKGTRRSLRLALPLSAKKPRKGFSEEQRPEQVEEIVSSPEENPTLPENSPPEQAPSPVPEKPKTKPSTKPTLKTSPPTRSSKRKAPKPVVSSSDSEEEPTPTPPSKRAKKSTSAVVSPSMEKFLSRHVVRGKVFKTSSFHQPELSAFIDKIRAQGWLELFTNTQLGCSVPELVAFYTNCKIHKGVVVSRVGGKRIQFDAAKLGELLGVPSTGFDTYVREDKSVLGESRLLELARRLSQETGLETPRAIRKGEMTPMHQLLYWFLLKNVIPRGQGRNKVDAMAQCLIDLIDREEQVNLPALMIRHMERIADQSREHDLGYGFHLTVVFEAFGVTLTKKVGVQFVDLIGSSTLLGCGFNLVSRTDREQGPRTPCPPVSESSSAGPSIEALAQAQAQLKAELDEERAETTKRYEALLSLLGDLSSKLSMPPPPAP